MLINLIKGSIFFWIMEIVEQGIDKMKQKLMALLNSEFRDFKIIVYNINNGIFWVLKKFFLMPNKDIFSSLPSLTKFLLPTSS